MGDCRQRQTHTSSSRTVFTRAAFTFQKLHSKRFAGVRLYELKQVCSNLHFRQTSTSRTSTFPMRIRMPHGTVLSELHIDQVKSVQFYPQKMCGNENHWQLGFMMFFVLRWQTSYMGNNEVDRACWNCHYWNSAHCGDSVVRWPRSYTKIM